MSQTLDQATSPLLPTIRWAVGSANGKRSNTWRIWGNRKGDVYIATRSLGHILKASLHKDGNCHLVFSEDMFSENRSVLKGFDSRYWEKWRLPDESDSAAYQVVIPEQELRVFSDDKSDRVQWLPAPPSGFLTVISLIIAPDDPTPTPTEQVYNPTLLGVFRSAVRTTWVIAVQCPIDDSAMVVLEGYREKANKEFSHIPGRSDLRVILVGNGANNDHFLIEMAWDNSPMAPM